MTIDGKRAARTDFNLHDEADLSESALDGVVGGSDGPTTGKRMDDVFDEVSSLLHDSATIGALEHAAGAGAGHGPAMSTANAQSNVIDSLVQKDAATLGDLSSKLSTADMGRLVGQIGSPHMSMTDAQIDTFAQTVAKSVAADTTPSAGTSSNGDNASVNSFLHGAANAAVMQSHLDRTGDLALPGTAAAGSMGVSSDPGARILHDAITSIAGQNAETLVGLSSTLSSEKIDRLVSVASGIHGDVTESQIASNVSDITKVSGEHNEEHHIGIGAQVSTLLQDVATANSLSADLSDLTKGAHGPATVTETTLKNAIDTLVQKDATTISDLSSKLSTQDMDKIIDVVEKGDVHKSDMNVDSLGKDVDGGFDLESRRDVASYLHDTANSTVLQTHLDKMNNPGPAGQSTGAETLHAAMDKIGGNADVTLAGLSSTLSSDDFIKLAKTGGDLGPRADDKTIGMDVDQIAGPKSGDGGGGGDHLDGVAGQVASLLHNSATMQNLSAELVSMSKSAEGHDPSTKSVEHALQVGIDTLMKTDSAALHDLSSVLSTTGMGSLIDAMSTTGSASIDDKAKDIAKDATDNHGELGVSSFLHDAANATVMESHLETINAETAGGHLTEETLNDALGATAQTDAAVLADLSSRLSSNQIDQLVNDAGMFDSKTTNDTISNAVDSLKSAPHSELWKDSHLNDGTSGELSSLYHGTASANILAQDLSHLPPQREPTRAETILNTAINTIEHNDAAILSDLSSKASPEAMTKIVEAISHGRPEISDEQLLAARKSIDAAGNSQVASYLEDAANTVVMRDASAGQNSDVTKQTLELAMDMNTQKNEAALGDFASDLTSAQRDKLMELAGGVDGKTTNADIDGDVMTIMNATAKTGADGQYEVTWSSSNIAKDS